MVVVSGILCDMCCNLVALLGYVIEGLGVVSHYIGSYFHSVCFSFHLNFVVDVAVVVVHYYKLTLNYFWEILI